MPSSFVIFELAVLIFSVMIHEIAHGAVALRLGDPTAKLAGRLTLNPAKHLDFFGSFLLPLSLYFLSHGSVMFGWAKPVPYNPMNLRNPKKGAGIIALAGPLTNLAVAVVFGLLVRMATPSLGPESTFVLFLHLIVLINILLAVFNLVPLPPLDGSGLLFSLLPSRYSAFQHFFMRYGFFILVVFIVFGFPLLAPIVNVIYHAIVGGTGLL